jgi:DNA-binding NtrC family response regulator
MKIPLIARCDANVLIVGETGTGKELFARAIHYSSPRASRPFMPVNCGAIPVDLVENELFGHRRGAFTNAFALQTGLIEEANGGTLFLDEIDCLPKLAQVKLLRFLQEREYRPLGSSKMRQANVRVIAASNLNLEEAVGIGKVRQDLFYRLNVISLALPPLRERREDIPLLARHFLEKYAKEFGKPTIHFSPNTLPLLMMQNWLGNVRELEHVIERATALCEGPFIIEGDLGLSPLPSAHPLESLQQAKAREIAQFEKNYIQDLLRSCSGNITKAARLAQKNRRAFWQLIQKHQIDVSRFKPTVF